MSVRITCISKAHENHEDPYVAISDLGWVEDGTNKVGRTLGPLLPAAPSPRCAHQCRESARNNKERSWFWYWYWFWFWYY